MNPFKSFPRQQGHRGPRHKRNASLHRHDVVSCSCRSFQGELQGGTESAREGEGTLERAHPAGEESLLVMLFMVMSGGGFLW